MRGIRTVVALEALALAALGFALLRRHHEPDPEWTSYVPLMQYDAFDGLTASTPILWLGISLGLALSGFVVLITNLIARQHDQRA